MAHFVYYLNCSSFQISKHLLTSEKYLQLLIMYGLKIPWKPYYTEASRSSLCRMCAVPNVFNKETVFERKRIGDKKNGSLNLWAPGWFSAKNQSYLLTGTCCYFSFFKNWKTPSSFCITWNFVQKIPLTLQKELSGPQRPAEGNQRWAKSVSCNWRL